MATNEFKAFATGAGANVITQAEYEALASLAAGFSAGTARSNELNKVWRQASIMAAVLAQLIVDQTGHDALDDGTTSALLENLKSAIQGLGSAQPASTTVAGIIEIATNAEHVAGASGDLAATPAGLAAVLQGAMMTYAVGSGSANAHTATYTPAVTALVDGMVLRFRAANGNTGASTFSPNGLAAKPILTAAHGALSGGEIAAGADVWLQYNASVGGWVSALAQPASTTAAGIIEIATDAEVIAGTDPARVVTPAGLESARPSKARCTAWVNFNGAPLNGTYSQSGTTITVTMTAHGMSSGQPVSLDFTTGTAVDGVFLVQAVADQNTFTVTAGASLTTSGNVTRQSYIRDSYNVSSVTDNGVGQYTVNFATPMVSENFCVALGPSSANVNTTPALLANMDSSGKLIPPSINGFRLYSGLIGAGAVDNAYVYASVFGGE